MSEKFQNKYRTHSTRLQNWDYGWNAAYFITICIKNKECYFGNINNGKIILSEIGIIAEQYWNEIQNQFSYVRLDAFVVMPDHIHGIIVIDKNRPGYRFRCIRCRGAINRVSTTDTIQKKTGGITGNKNPMLNDNLSRIIRWYKGRVTFEIRKIQACFEWQPRFYDHIVRDDKSFLCIRKYINNNPANWTEE